MGKMEIPVLARQASVHLFLSPLRRAALSTALAVFAVVFALGLAELGLRVLWTNPYDYEVLGRDYPDFIMFNRPANTAIYDVSGVYEGAGRVLFRTGQKGEVLGARASAKPVAYFLGGSTTESRYVTEGKRWPDLIQGISPVNFGKSGNTVFDSYFNLKFLLQAGHRPAEVYLMNGYNDFFARERTVDQWAARNDGTNRAPDPNRLGQRSYTVALMYTVYLKLILPPDTTKLLDVLKEGRYIEGSMPEREVDQALAQELPYFFEHRREVFRQLAILGQTHCVPVVVLTQPDAFRDDFRPWNDIDLRHPMALAETKPLTFKQSRRLMDRINQHTRETASEFGLRVIDVRRSFDTVDPSPLFFDAIHYTAAGSEFFASVVTKARQAERLVPPRPCSQ